jgi:3',5'-cyclic AMP phosphodiesterase CpdA
MPDSLPRFFAPSPLCVLLVAAAGATGCSDTEGVADPSGSNGADAHSSAETGTLEDASARSRSDADPASNAPDDAGPDSSQAPPAPVYPLTDQPYTTLQQTWAPLDPDGETLRSVIGSELNVTDIEKYEQYDLGVERHEGQSWVVHNELAPDFEATDIAPRERRSLLYFWQAADPQLIDEESPIRFAGTTLTPIGSTYRPQSHLTLQAFESQVRTARRLSERSGRPFDFTFLAGDVSDGGQANEINWTIRILNGGVVDPDSGVDNDPIPGPGNDYTDPFHARGIGVPWYVALGNHETQYMGTFPVTEGIREAAVGNEVIDLTDVIEAIDPTDGFANGYRDASTKTAEVVTEGTTPADSRRKLLRLREVLETLHSAGGRPKGHGLSDADVREGRGYFSTHPVPGKPIRFIALNTLMTEGTHVSGGVSEEQFAWLKRQLEEADRQSELVVVGAHHRIASVARLSEVSADRIERLLARHDNVVLYTAGHGHKNVKRLVSPGDHRGFWELMAPSNVDFPMQTRIFEFVWEGNRHLSIYVTNVGQNAPPGTMAHRARTLAAGRKIFLRGQVRDSWEKQLDDMNLVLRVEVPKDVARNIESSSWPKRIESIETLEALEAPERRRR